MYTYTSVYFNTQRRLQKFKDSSKTVFHAAGLSSNLQGDD